MPWAVVGGVVSAIGAGSAADKNAKAAKKASAQGSTTTVVPWAEQIPYLKELFANALKGYQNGDFGRVAGFTADDMIGRQGMRDAAGNIQGMLPGANAAWQNQLNAPDLKNNPYINDYIQAALNPIQQRLMEQVLPQTRSDAVSSGMFGGSRQGVGEGIALKGWQQQSGDITSNILNSAYNTGMQSQGNALKMAPLIMQMQTMGPQILQQLGLQQRQMSQAELDQAYNSLQMYQNLVGGQQWGSTSNTVNPNYVGNNSFGAGLGGFASGLALYNQLNQGSKPPATSGGWDPGEPWY